MGFFSTWVDQKLAVADRLAAGECGGDYVDAVILMAAALSGIASDLWPGQGIDRKRFIELWVRFAKPEASRVSLPLLMRFLEQKGRSSEAAAVCALQPGRLDPSVLVIVGDGADISEEDLRKRVPAIPVRDLRRHSYPALFYRSIRCAGVHEYQLDKTASSRFMAHQQKSLVSYVNELEDDHRIVRLIHFHATPLRRMIADLARRADNEQCPSENPTVWWIDR